MMIQPANVADAAAFLHTNLNDRVSADHWAEAVRVPWPVDAPNHGFLLRRDDGIVVGVLLAFYSQRVVGGAPERFCNLGAWCVLPEFRFQSLRLLKAALGQPGYHFTDLSPSGPVVPLNVRLGFDFLDTTTALVPCVPVMSRTQVVTNHVDLPTLLDSVSLTIFQDHRGAAAARHAVLSRGGRRCYVVYRRDRRRGRNVFASVLYVSDPVVFRSGVRALGGHLLLHEGVLGLLVEARIAGPVPGSIRVRQSRPKMFRSATLPASAVDNLYSELCCVAW